MLFGRSIWRTLRNLIDRGEYVAEHADQIPNGFLYGIGALDPVAFLGVPALLIVVAFLAALVPARRASKVNPVQAMRSE